MHAKTPCCRGHIRRFGNRRRQCVLCLRTWRIRQKKRGRKRIRVSTDLVRRFLNREFPSLRSLARQKQISRECLRRRMNRSLDHYLATASFPDKILSGDEPLIMIADAMWHWVRHKKWTVYVILLKPLHGDTAVVVPPLLHPGHECDEGWRSALDRVGEYRRGRVVALVSDGVHTLLRQATRYGWCIQRCHFHLLSSLQNYATTGPRSKNREFAITLMNTVKELISTTDPQRIMDIQNDIRTLLITLRSRGLRRVLGGLLHDLPQFRTYLTYPDLNLPTTSNAAESAIQKIRDLLYRTRGFNTLSALQKWIHALFLNQPTITCNGHKSTD